MRIAVVGVGALGALLVARMARAGFSVSALEQGDQLQAIRHRGLTLLGTAEAEPVEVEVPASDRGEDLGPQDVVLLAVKAHQIESTLDALLPLFHDDTMLVTLQNGLPWWYFQHFDGPLAGQSLRSLDPRGHLAAAIAPERIVGCVAYPAAELVEPGVARHIEGNRFTLGEPDGTISPRCEALAQAFIDAGFKSYVIDDIRSELWLKAWGALSFNTISALTGATMAGICRFEPSRALAERMMLEAQEVAGKLGVTFRHTIEKRIAGAEAVGEHKTSMLQDFEAGRSLEVEAVIGSIVELAGITDTPVPTIKAVYACCQLLNERLQGAA